MTIGKASLHRIIPSLHLATDDNPDTSGIAVNSVRQLGDGLARGDE
jgi:hypothetical protein